MKSFHHTMQTNYPMLFGTAGRLAELAHCYPDTIGILEMGSRRADISHPMNLMTMGVRKGDRVTISAEGPSEAELIDVLYEYFDCAM